MNECGSLQTEQPYWLEQAYSSNLSNLDTGAAQRNLHNWMRVYFVAKIFKLKNAIDFGGGDGLLCRLLKDYGLNCYIQDMYANPTYAQGFTEPDFKTPDLVVAFEVLEHFTNPCEELKALFCADAKVIFISTGIYKNESPDWWYLAPESGQHIFFYTEQALQYLANKYAYELLIIDGNILFIKPEELSPFRRYCLKKALKGGRINRYLRKKCCCYQPLGFGRIIYSRKVR